MYPGILERRRKEEHRLPRYRFPAVFYDLRPEKMVIDTSNRALLFGDRSGNSEINVLCLNGVNGNYASVPDSVALSITGPIDMAVRLMLPSWTPTTDFVLLEKYGIAGNRSWEFRLKATTGLLSFVVSVDGTAASTVVSSVAPVVSAFGVLWLRVTRDSTTGTVTFYTAADSSTIPTVWSQLGTTVATTVGSIFDNTNPLTIGADYAGLSAISGNILQAILYNGIGGTVVFNVNFANANKLTSSLVESSVNGATVTINTVGDVGARISGSRDVVQFTVGKAVLYTAPSGGQLSFVIADGSNDYSKAAPFSYVQPAVIFNTGQQVTWANADYVFAGGTSALPVGLRQEGVTPQFDVTASTGGTNNAGWPLATLATVTALCDGANTTSRVNRKTEQTGAGGGTDAPAGMTLFSNNGASAFGNVTLSEFVAYQGSQYDAIARDRITRQSMRRHRIAV